MARSKALLFTEKEQLSSQLCKAMAHPARVRMMGRLLRHRAVSYDELVADIPLGISTIGDHLKMLIRLGFIVDMLLPDEQCGYALNRPLYRDCTAATRSLVGGALIVGMGLDEQKVAG